MKTGTANLPLHTGFAPPWLFKRMVSLAGEVVEALVYEHGPEEFLRRIADPNWFQALACVLGFDWHSSGTTTVTTGALKTAVSPERHGIAVAGGKGKTSGKAPQDKQGMNDSYARRYHWLSDKIESFVEEPHSGICSQRQEQSVLDLTARESCENRKATLDLVRDGPSHLRSAQASLLDFGPSRLSPALELSLPRRHELLPRLDIDEAGRKALQMAYELQPSSYEDLVALKGMGPRRIRALALISELIYGARPSWRDPAKYSFAHGGKDGTPFPVDRETYDHSVRTLKEALEGTTLDKKEKYEAIKRLSSYAGL